MSMDRGLLESPKSVKALDHSEISSRLNRSNGTEKKPMLLPDLCLDVRRAVGLGGLEFSLDESTDIIARSLKD